MFLSPLGRQELQHIKLRLEHSLLVLDYNMSLAFTSSLRTWKSSCAFASSLFTHNLALCTSLKIPGNCGIRRRNRSPNDIVPLRGSAIVCNPIFWERIVFKLKSGRFTIYYDVASACCCCNDKIEENGEAETRAKNIIAVIPLANITLESSALFVILVTFFPCNRKFIHILDT